MKKLLFSLLGAAIFGGGCIGVTWGIGAVFGPMYQGEDESTRNFKIFLGVFLLSIILGAISGFVYGKKATNNGG